MAISMNIKADHFIKQLGKKGVSLQQTAAETLNESAEQINKNYKTRLKKKTRLRNKFAMNSVKIFKAHGVSKSGTPRPLHKIDAVVGVRKMKGNKQHYLAKLENNTTQKGSPLTKGKVPVPLNTARTTGNYNRAIAGPNRLTKQKTQTLKTGSRRIGVRGDGYNSTRKRWGALYGSIRSGKISGDPRKPFFMIDNKNKIGIFKMKGKKVRKIRKLEKSTVKHKAEPHFQNSVKQESPKKIQQRFIRNAKKKLGMR